MTATRVSAAAAYTSTIDPAELERQPIEKLAESEKEQKTTVHATPSSEEPAESPIPRWLPFPDIHLSECKKKFNDLNSDLILAICTSSLYRDHGRYYPLANDALLSAKYISKLQELCEEKSPKPNLPYQLGVIIGNGHIFSLINKIPANLILLIDIEPSVLYYFLTVRDYIVNCKIFDSFEVTKDRILKKIRTLENTLLHLNSRLTLTSLGFEEEMKALGVHHVLDNEEQFESCRNALKQKTIMPLTGDIFNPYWIERVVHTLSHLPYETSFVNLTNVVQYYKGSSCYREIEDDDLAEARAVHTVIENLSRFRIADSCKFIFTRTKSRYDLETYTTKNMIDFKDKLIKSLPNPTLFYYIQGKKIKFNTLGTSLPLLFSAPSKDAAPAKKETPRNCCVIS